MPVLTSLTIPLNFEGVTNEIGRYLFAKILIADVHTCSWVINSLYSAIYLPGTILKYNSEFLE